MSFLQPTIYKPIKHEPVSRHTPNTIIADDRLPRNQMDREITRTAQRASKSFSYFRRSEPTEPFVSPIEDDFPTPRAFSLRNPPSPMSCDGYLVSPVDEKPNNTRPPDFDDMYDATDDEIDRDEPLEIDVIPPEDEDAPPVIVRRPSTRSAHAPIRTDSLDPGIPRNRYPSLAIPRGGKWSGPHEIKMNSPVPPTPPPKIPISPAALSLLARDAPDSTAPPSLDGSLTSDQLANSTAPPTPSIPTPEIAGVDPAAGWSEGGIQLHPDALATLNVLPSNGIGHQYEDQIIEEQGIEERVIETPHPQQQMQQIPNYSLHRSAAIRIAPPNRRSLASMAQVDIPSPSTFFSQLASPTRNTWCPTSPHPLSSSTAENFYTYPWNKPIEQVVEVEEDASDGPPTARPTILHDAISEEPAVEEPANEGRPSEESAASKDGIVEEHIETSQAGVDFDQKYRRELKHTSMINLDRTSQWLSTQSTYLTALKDLKEEIHAKIDEEAPKPETEVVDRASVSTKKSVRFSQDLDGQEEQGQSAAVVKKESAYYRAFQRFSGNSNSNDAFTYRQTRSDALHAQRICQPVTHILQLSSQYELKRRTIHEDATPEEKQEARAAREAEAVDQMNLAMWNVAANMVLNQGKLLVSPVAKKLAQAGKAPAVGILQRDRTRILDLGGQPVCDWAWHCARQFPNTKVYTVYPKTNLSQLTNPTAIRGPHNHRSVSVPQLHRLPFAENYFDVIVVRSIYMFLKAKNMIGAPREFDDEYDLCLKECYRCLKPGGYLEFSLLDADIMNAGPLGSAMSVEFSFRLKTRGYDPYPTRAWTGRLQKAGFGTVKRAWVFLPMGAPATTPNVPSKRDEAGPGKSSDDVREKGEEEKEKEEEVQGTTPEVAGITGLVGSWAWEKWMLKLHTEVGKRGASALDGVNAVLEEGRKGGAGWRSLCGYARKPLERA